MFVGKTTIIPPPTDKDSKRDAITDYTRSYDFCGGLPDGLPDGFAMSQQWIRRAVAAEGLVEELTKQTRKEIIWRKFAEKALEKLADEKSNLTPFQVSQTAGCALHAENYMHLNSAMWIMGQPNKEGHYWARVARGAKATIVTYISVTRDDDWVLSFITIGDPSHHPMNLISWYMPAESPKAPNV